MGGAPRGACGSNEVHLRGPYFHFRLFVTSLTQPFQGPERRAEGKITSDHSSFGDHDSSQPHQDPAVIVDLHGMVPRDRLHSARESWRNADHTLQVNDQRIFLISCEPAEENASLPQPRPSLPMPMMIARSVVLTASLGDSRLGGFAVATRWPQGGLR